MLRRGFEKRHVVGITADHAVHDDDVGRLDGAADLDEVPVAAGNAALQPVLREQLGRLVVVLLRKLDHRRLPRSSVEKLDVDRSDPTADLEHGCV